MNACRAAIIGFILVTFSAVAWAETISLPLTDDTWIRAGKPDKNYGDYTTMRINESGGQQALIRFDAAAISGQVIGRATLKLYASNITNDGDISISAIASSWSETKVTWNLRPPTVAFAVSMTFISSSDTVISVDVTSVAQRWADGSLPDAGLLIRTSDIMRAYFITQEGTASGGSAAELEVQIGTPAPEQILTVDTLVDENDGDLSPGDVSLREAIFFVAPGGAVDFSTELSGGTITLTLGQLEITKDLSINGLGADQIAVSGNNMFRVLRVDDGNYTNASIVGIDGMTITKGRAVGGNAVGDGAGVFNEENLILTNSVISSNESSNVSGGIFNNRNGSIVVRNCEILENVGPFGAGFRNYGTGEIVDSLISGNRATGFGGGIDNFGGSLEIISTTITGNSADRGGGIGVGGADSGHLVLVDSTVSDNTAREGAGIIANDPVEISNSLILNNQGEGITARSELSITNSTVAYNSPGIVNKSGAVRIKDTTIVSPDGQGLRNFDGTMDLVNSTTTGLGTGHPGLDVFGGVVRVTSSTISNHGVAGGGGGISGVGGTVTLHNTILALNEADFGPDCDREVISLGHNVIGDPSGCDITLQPTDLTGEPGVGPFIDDGMPGNGHFPLLSTSQGIDAGDNDACTPADQLGNPRYDGDGDGMIVCDIGAIEYQGEQYEVAIDFKPGNRRNVINPHSKGRFWLAILSDEEFDALQVDPESVALGEGGASPDRYRVKDVNRDRFPDLMLRFRTPELGLQCGDTEVELTGETYAGDSIAGTDAVKTVGCKKPKKGKMK